MTVLNTIGTSFPDLADAVARYLRAAQVVTHSLRRDAIPVRVLRDLRDAEEDVRIKFAMIQVCVSEGLAG